MLKMFAVVLMLVMLGSVAFLGYSFAIAENKETTKPTVQFTESCMTCHTFGTSLVAVPTHTK